MSFDEHTCTILLRTCLAVELLDHRVYDMFSFNIVPKTISRLIIPPTAMYEGLAYSISFLTLGGFYPSHFSHFSRGVRLSYCGFNSHFLDACWASFHIFICHLEYSFFKCLLDSFALLAVGCLPSFLRIY